MLRRSLLVLLSALSLAACAATTATLRAPDALERQGTVAQSPARRSIDVYVGQRNLDTNDWAPVDEHTAFGAIFVYEPTDLAFGIEAGIQHSEADPNNFLVPILGTVDFRSEITEVYGGIHKSIRVASSIEPYIGAGLSFATVRFEGSGGGGSSSDDDTTSGVYIHAGVAFLPGPRLRVGVDVRTVMGTDVTLFGVPADINSNQVVAFVGGSF